MVGGGAAGFFAAIAAAEAGADVTLLEKTSRFLDKLRISGGGRCNFTHACFDPRELAKHFPRGGHALLSPFQKFSARDTVAWFESRGVKLKTEPDDRMLPIAVIAAIGSVSRFHAYLPEFQSPSALPKVFLSVCVGYGRYFIG